MFLSTPGHPSQLPSLERATNTRAGGPLDMSTDRNTSTDPAFLLFKATVGSYFVAPETAGNLRLDCTSSAAKRWNLDDEMNICVKPLLRTTPPSARR